MGISKIPSEMQQSFQYKNLGPKIMDFSKNVNKFNSN